MRIKRALHNTCLLRFLGNILQVAKEIIFSKQPKETVKKSLSLSFTVETFHEAPSLEGLERGTNSKVWRIFFPFQNFFLRYFAF